ncbi:hypothetical protein KC953_01830 [Candidatus Saccharibacteria bacterium]|nr:hypothetical protein [Candidatus Saccharibacteria bacterium]
MQKGIALIGMPASGKTTISRELAARLNRPLLDVDQWMEAHEKRPLSETIATKGKKYTLDLETACIRDHDLRELILSTPGSIIYNDVLDLLREKTHIIWLDVPFEVIEERLAPDVDNQRGVIGLKEKGLRALYDERTPLYRKWATHTIDCGDKDVEAIVLEIAKIAMP